MDAKDSVFVFAVWLLSLGLFGSLTYGVWNKQIEMASELADVHNELHKLQDELKNQNSRVHLGTSDPSQDKSQLRRNVRQADEDTDTPSATEILTNALTEIIERKLVSYISCNRNEYNHTKCTITPGPKGEPGPEGPTGEKGTKGEPGNMGHKGEPGNKGVKGNLGYPGYKGEKGEESVVGSQGPPGPTGPQGPSGIQGKDGQKGEQGAVGPKGDTGPHGSTGEKGEKGDMGERGLKGDMGLPGETGDTGQKGEPGNKGEKGEEGAAPPTVPTTVPTTASTTALTTAPTTVPATATPGQCGGPGWRRVVFLNMTNTSHVCPTGLSLTSYSRRTCGRARSGSLTCSSTSFRVGGSRYSSVCGRALAYRFGYNYAFLSHHANRQGIDDQYVDGLSLTHGFPGSRKHIWTFASGRFTGSRSSSYRNYRCPCDNVNTYRSPSFVGNDYFCESILTDYVSLSRHYLYPNAPLWDGQVCEGGGTCCHFNNPPWFTKNLGNYTTDRIELRLCLRGSSSYSDIALEQLELYVQ